MQKEDKDLYGASNGGVVDSHTTCDELAQQ